MDNFLKHLYFDVFISGTDSKIFPFKQGSEKKFYSIKGLYSDIHENITK